MWNLLPFACLFGLRTTSPLIGGARDGQGPLLDDLDQRYPPQNVDYGNDNPENDEDDHNHLKDSYIGPKPHWDADDYDLWTSVRIKLDALHAMMRFERTLRYLTLRVHTHVCNQLLTSPRHFTNQEVAWRIPALHVTAT